ncbi:hypothetical protein DFH08DRAFT_385108 [Mycena albidolilacea]|uniref:Uncharacterized protein n=1 Tax=Mycena albidolilacea TaxID=1033008 RepID=A0AAD6ZF99_9AGAR|nr:hypothetical protein DFH08DRAFT_385108 [Mycena albidolilacea]
MHPRETWLGPTIGRWEAIAEAPRHLADTQVARVSLDTQNLRTLNSACQTVSFEGRNSKAIVSRRCANIPMSQRSLNTKNLTTLITARQINSTRLYKGIVRLSRRSARTRVALNTEDLPTFHTVHQPFNISGLSSQGILIPSRRSANIETRIAVNTQNVYTHDSAKQAVSCEDHNSKRIDKRQRIYGPSISPRCILLLLPRRTVPIVSCSSEPSTQFLILSLRKANMPC